MTILTLQGYNINGYTFYTKAQDNKSTNQNSGVHIDAYDTNGEKDTYYEWIEEIWELDYGPLKVPLFQCERVGLDGMKIDKHGMTIVELGLIAYEEEPFIPSRNISQVFYVKDQAGKYLHVALQEKKDCRSREYRR